MTTSSSCRYKGVALTYQQSRLLLILFDGFDNKPLPNVYTAMPLYLGHLRSRDMSITEQFIRQIAEGLQIMHSICDLTLRPPLGVLFLLQSPVYNSISRAFNGTEDEEWNPSILHGMALLL